MKFVIYYYTVVFLKRSRAWIRAALLTIQDYYFKVEEISIAAVTRFKKLF